MTLIDYLTLTAGAVLAILALTIAVFRLIEAAEHTRIGVFGFCSPEGDEHD